MRLNELRSDLLPEMAYTKKKAEAVITGLEFPLNHHLLKLAAVPSAEVSRWRNETLAGLAQTAAIRLKPENKPCNSGFYFKILFDEPFGGVEVPNITSRLQLLRLQYGRLAPDVQPEELAPRLRSFHTAFAHGCAAATMTPSKIAKLVDQFIRKPSGA